MKDVNSWHWHDRVFVGAAVLFVAAGVLLVLTVALFALTGLKPLLFMLALVGVMVASAVTVGCMAPFRIVLDARHLREIRRRP